MDLKIWLLLQFLLGIFCEIDYSSLINSTQHLQDIERGGIYPQLNFDSIIHPTAAPDRPLFPAQQHPPPNISLSSDSSKPFYYGSIIHPTMNSSKEYEKFVNKTRNSFSSGFCTKEVPTTLLLRKNELLVAGNGSDPGLSTIQVCCDGYQRDVHIFRKCNPICSNGCSNGICAAPETCLCYPNFVKNFNGQCITACPTGCENGFCNGDNTCNCDEGYTAEPDKKFCILKCSDGFRAINGVCQPICSSGCENGFCTAPEQCQCKIGWKLDATGSKCLPKCERSCLNGVCSSPNICSCKFGYVKDFIDQYRCNPICNPPCENAICSGANMCLCHQGYVKDRSVTSGNKCVRV